MISLFPRLSSADAKPALQFGDRSLSYSELASAAGKLAAGLASESRVALWATPTLETAVAAVACLLVGTPVVPVNPKSGVDELRHIIDDSAPSLILADPESALPQGLRLPRRDIAIESVRPVALPPDPGEDAAALIVYTSGTTGPPKGAVLPRRAIRATVDALRDAWEWTAEDVLVHALPLFHVHGLVLGTLGPLRLGGTLRHIGRFDLDGVRTELESGATMMFGVPTMYHRIAQVVAEDTALASALASARLLVSGSAALSLPDHQAITDATGKQVVERYGMTETLMNTSVRIDGVAKPGSVGLPLNGVRLRLVDDSGDEVTDTETIGEVQVRGPNLFTEYLNRPDATAQAFVDGWFRTGDMATRDADGYIRLVGRQSTDLIKSGGFKIGAGEIENVLLDHPDIAEAAVTGEPDADLGECVVAWIVPADAAAPLTAEAVSEHVAGRLAPHKRPRIVRFVSGLPRNAMGKVMKRELREEEDGT